MLIERVQRSLLSRDVPLLFCIGMHLLTYEHRRGGMSVIYAMEAILTRYFAMKGHVQSIHLLGQSGKIPKIACSCRVFVT